MIPFPSRLEAGRLLASQFQQSGLPGSPMLIALPRGGFSVAAAAADNLDVAWHILPVEPIFLLNRGVIGAVAAHDVEVWRDGFPSNALHHKAADTARDRLSAIPASPALGQVAGGTALIVDEGADTGARMLAAIRCIRKLGAVRIIAGIPVAPPDTVKLLARECDDVLCLASPSPFHDIAQFYIC